MLSIIGSFFFAQQRNRDTVQVFADSDCVSSAGVTCTQTTDGAYTINTYTLSGSITASTTWTPPTNVNSAEVLVVAGGGGGGFSYNRGGGGAGGLVYHPNKEASGSITIQVGAGGAAATGHNSPGGNGGNSVFGDITALGGGYGGIYYTSCTGVGDGGSGGGGVGASCPGGSATQTNSGGGTGYGFAGASGGSSTNSGGGGGAGGVGLTGAANSGGAGGPGRQYSITGTSLYYAGGGGGSGYTLAGGLGGSGIGGDGGYTSAAARPNGTDGTGSGGGGGYYDGTERAGGKGGSGVVIIRYLPIPDGGVFTMKKEDGCSCSLASECYSGACSSNICGSEVYTSTNLTCYITSGSCPGTTVFKIYDQAGGHAELASQLNYSNKVCCVGTGISNSCSGYHDVALSLYSETDSHVEKDTESNYTNDACLHSDTMPVTCDYSTDCSLLGPEFVCLSSISGDTNAHVGSCSVYTNKVCCMIGVTVDNCVAKVATDRSISSKNLNIQFCSGADVSNSSDPCYSVCWKGTGAPNLGSSDWKCGICHDSENNLASCSTLASTTYSWVMPTGYVAGTDYTLIGASTLTSANPIINFTNSDDNRTVTLNIGSMGTTCSGLSSIRAIPNWKEISPF